MAVRTSKAETSEGMQLPPFFPADTVHLTRWDEVIEALRSSQLHLQPHAVSELLGGVVSMLDGPAHRQRRRALNRLVSAEAVEMRRSEVEPVLLEAMREMLKPSVQPGLFECDLVPLAHRVFVGFAARLIGLEGAESAEALEALRAQYEPMPLAHSVRYITGGDQEIVLSALAAKAAYEERFFSPSLAAMEKQLTGDGEPAPAQHTLLEILARRGDPAWEDRDLALRESLGFLIGSIDTSMQTVAHAVRELSGWFASHPEDRALLDDRAFMVAALKESLRLNPPQPHLTRTAAEDVVLSSGRQIPKGRRVAINRVLANRDPGVWGPDAEQFDPRRQPPATVPSYGVTFGGGPHMCIGMRMVVGVQDEGGSHVDILRTLLKAGVHPDPDRAAVKVSSYLNKFTSYPVRFSNWNG